MVNSWSSLAIVPGLRAQAGRFAREAFRSALAASSTAICSRVRRLTRCGRLRESRNVEPRVLLDLRRHRRDPAVAVIVSAFESFGLWPVMRPSTAVHLHVTDDALEQIQPRVFG